MNACRIAGLSICKILPEPAAAAFAYAMKDENLHVNKTCLIFDFGGGTLDVTILKLDNRNYEIIGFNGDPSIGG